MGSESDILNSFHPVVADWFKKKYAAPTDIQQQSWPFISSGRNTLICAPTGSGKTLTAFLSALDSMISGRLSTGGLRVLYISPLKALNNDIQRNLLAPLEELKQAMQLAGHSMPPIRVAVRSGDTPDDERRSMLRNPPEILITTPESLNILLTSQSGRRIFEGLTVVILDEIHAVAATKRGVHLMTGVERAELLCPGFQRIALSATVRPLERVAAFIGGYAMRTISSSVTYVPRSVALVESHAAKQYSIEVDFPVVSEKQADLGEESPPARSEWPEDVLFGSVVKRLKEVIKANRSTLIFTNSRRMAEKISMLLNEGEEEILAYCHHGALSREIRSVVEKSLKEGSLAAVVATASLELGIDIGDLDEVVLIQSPGFLSTTLQRLGRAGHSVGEVSRGLFLPLHGRDLLQSAILAGSIETREVEEVRPIKGALDLLAQIILSMVCAESWNPEELLAFLRSTYSYHDLSEAQFRAVIEMLSGRFAASRIRELRPRIHFDPIKNEISASSGAAFLIYMNGGTIPDRGYYGLRHLDTKSRIGELDEEFVWERSIGDSFVLGNQSWRIMEINHNDVLVRPAPFGAAAMAPFWRADAQDRDAFVSEKLARFLEEKGPSLEDESLCRELESTYHLSQPAARYLQEFLVLQTERTRSELPHRHHLLIEHYEDPMNRSDRKMVLLHTLWGGQVNRPFALAIRGAFLQEFDLRVQTISDDDCILVMLPHEFSEGQLFELIRSDILEHRLKAVLSSTGFYGALFRQSAGIAMLLPGKGFKSRTPLWLNRLRTKKLLEATASFEDFPITLETWRSSLSDSFDLTTLSSRLQELESGAIRISEVFTKTPSPFAQNLIWQQTNTFMYQDDRPGSAVTGRPGDDFFRELAKSSGLRPSIPMEVVRRYRGRMMCTSEGYEPDDLPILMDLIRDRVLINPEEFKFYKEALQSAKDQIAGKRTGKKRSDMAGPEANVEEALDRGLARILDSDNSIVAYCALESVPLLYFAFPDRFTRPAADPESPPIFWIASEKQDSKNPGRSSAAISGAGHHIVPGTPGAFRFQVSEEGQIALTRIWQNRRDSAESEIATPEPEDLASDLLLSYMRYFGPLLGDELAATFFASETVERALGRLIEEGRVLQGSITAQSADGRPNESTNADGSSQFHAHDSSNAAMEPPAVMEICEAETLEILLRMTRSHYRPDFEPLPVTDLQLFLADYQGLTRPGADREDLQQRMEQLIAYPARASLWETEILPARLNPYFPAWLDSLSDFGLFWFGCGKEIITFLMDRDLPLVVEGSAVAAESDANDLERLFPHANGRFGFFDLLAQSGESAESLTAKLWDLAWKGKIGNDSMASLRTGIDHSFKSVSAGVPGRSARSRWSGSIASAGSWRRFSPSDGKGLQDTETRQRVSPIAPDAPLELDSSANSLGLLESEQLQRERVQVLLGRYGILFRQLLMRELPPMQWKSIMPTLRRMELSGEVIGGYFFHGISSLQFMSPSAFRRLGAGLSRESIFWMNALDPASLCGVSLDGLTELPRRLAGNHILFSGASPVLISHRNGKDLEIRVRSDDPDLQRYLQFFLAWLGRERNPRNRVEVEKINGKEAGQSEYQSSFLQAGFYKAQSSLILHRKY